MDNWQSQIPEEMRADDKFLKLASHKGEDVASDSIQNIVQEIIANAYRNTATATLVGTNDSYCRMIIDLYSNDYFKKIADTKYGAGSCDYIVEAFRYYLNKDDKAGIMIPTPNPVFIK